VREVLAFTLVFLVGATLVTILLLLLRRVRRTSGRVVLAGVVGYVTAYTVSFLGFLFKSLLPTKAPVSWRLVDVFEWVYEQVFGIATFVARLFSPNYIAGSDLILPEDEAGALAAHMFPMIFWSAVFGGVYFLFIRSRERSNQTMERTADRCAPHF
jgi:Na+-transporting NADH:ubiquinone oxidoreductase subunit NqrB